MRLHVEKIDYANKLAERYVKALWAVASESNVQNEVSKDMSAIRSSNLSLREVCFNIYETFNNI